MQINAVGADLYNGAPVSSQFAGDEESLMDILISALKVIHIGARTQFCPRAVQSLLHP